MTTEEQLKQMYIPNAVKRAVFRTLDIAKELKSLLNKSPDKIFIEMARGNDGKTKKGARTDSRRKQIIDGLNAAREFMDDSTISELKNDLEKLSDSDLRSEKYFLYFMQLGRCMYSNQAIDFSKIGNDSIYNIDHIYPQAKVKDDSIDNKVLVLSGINGAKKDVYPIDPVIRENMRGFWNKLKKIIGEEKYKRLTRTSPFTEEELSGFINRQLVETRQSTKAVATLLKDIFPESEIVYVKAGIVSEFRQKMDMLKCREINDLHHAKDAYLNIVMGNVYNVKFTKNPMAFIKSGEAYSMNLFKKSCNGKESGLLTHRIERNGECAWDPERSFNTVRKTMAKNSIRYVKYTYRRKSGQNGGFYDQNPLRAGHGTVRIKKDLPIEQYGGFDNATISFFSIVGCKGFGNILVSVELLYASKFENDIAFAKNYAAEAISNIMNKHIESDNIDFPLGNRIVKINSMLEFDETYRVNIAAKTGNSIKYVSAMSLVVSADTERYCKRISSVIEKSKSMKEFRITEFDKITPEENLCLFDILCDKCRFKPFSLLYADLGNKMSESRDSFAKLSSLEQVKVLAEMIRLLKTGRKTGVDLQKVGGNENSGIKTLNVRMYKIDSFKSIRIIDQSSTGLLEKKSPNLLEI